MSFDYSRLRSTADRLIEKFGVTAVLRKEGELGGPTFEPVRGDPSFHRIVLVRSSKIRYNRDSGVRLVSDTLTVRTLEGTTPATGDKIMVSGAESFLLAPMEAAFVADYSVGVVRTLSPAGTALTHVIEVDL